MRAAVEIVLPYVSDGRKIVVFGDYDCDGVCASAILVMALRRLGAQVEAFIPDRFGEGYGMTAASLERLLREHPDTALVITVDNGVNAVDEVPLLKARGIAVVVTDHHLPGPELPAADAVLDPRVASVPGCEALCGAGVAFFLASALARAAAERGLYDGGKFGAPLLVLAGLATVTDLMPLVAQNRILVAQSLAAFRACAPVGLRELLDHASRRANDLVSRDYGFVLGPRINAAGRMTSAREAYELIMETDREAARLKAVGVDARNGERKTREKQMYDEARAQIASFDGLSAVVVADTPARPWHSGVAGIVAARLMEDARVPVAVVVGTRGSARAPEGYNVRDALGAATAVLTRFGGHAAAGGFNVEEGKLDDFRTLFAAACADQRAQLGEAADRRLVAHAWVEPADLTRELYDDMKKLEPFGEGNPEPVFGLRNVSFANIRPIGTDGRHVCFSFTNRAIPRAVWWGRGGEAEQLRARAAARFDVTFTLVLSDYGYADEPHLELRLVDVCPAT